MGTWLTYLIAFLLSGATAFAFPEWTGFYETIRYLSNILLNVGIFLFIPISFITFIGGIASLKKDSLEGKAFCHTLLWTIFTSVILSLLAIIFSTCFSLSLPVTASAGGNYTELFSSYNASFDTLGVSSLMNTLFLPLILFAFVLGIALTPSADVIRPAYTVINSFSEVMYRIERTISYFGALYLYLAGTSFFITLWREKTLFVSPNYFINILISSFIIILVVLPLLYAFFTGFRKNPYAIIGKCFSSLLFALISGNIYLTALQSEAITRTNLGVQKRIVSTSFPFGILITRGGTCFISTVSVLSILNALGADVTINAAVIIALTSVILSLLSHLSAGSETAFMSILIFKTLNINVYGAEAALISIIPILNGIATMIDITLINMAANIIAKKTRTDIIVPLRDAI